MDRQNKADPDQIALRDSLKWVYTICKSTSPKQSRSGSRLLGLFWKRISHLKAESGKADLRICDWCGKENLSDSINSNTCNAQVLVKATLLYFLGYKMKLFTFKTKKNLDPSYKTVLDLSDCIGREKLVL